MSPSSPDQKDTASTLGMPLLPLKDIVVFPNMIVPVFVNEDLCINAIKEALKTDKKIFLSAFKVNDAQYQGLECSLEPPFDVYDVGTVCTIMRTRNLPDGRMKVLVQGLEKARVKSLDKTEPFPYVSLSAIPEPTLVNSTSTVEALIRAVRENLEKVVSLGKILSPDILMILEDVNQPGRLADLISSNLGLKVAEAQSVLAIHNPVDRLQKVHGCLSREIEVYQMQVKIQTNAKDEIGRMQREHYLREQMRAIKSELGDADGKDEIETLWKKMDDVCLTQEARDEVTRQLKRLERMHQDSSEATLTRTHIETILSLPWGERTPDVLDLKNVKKILDEDHFGLDQVKDRIIEYLAVKKLNPKAKSPIICFAGPPGVGKTSLGRSIAKSMGRSFSRIALGGVRDEADIRGHRKTYIGAYPGRVINSIKQSSSINPVIMLDEIDKLGSDHRGDPSSSLLEVLDPEQNKAFVDHYLGVAFDLSQILFIANANNIDQIPAPLRDRMEIIEVGGYSEEEKISIANSFLIPKEVKEAGFELGNVSFSRAAVEAVIKGYTKESGLRTLQKRFATICRKIARKYAESDLPKEEYPHTKVTPAAVQKFLGPYKFTDTCFHLEPMVGVSLGMAYTNYGGEILPIETNLIPSGTSKLVLTGQLGDVMKESAQAALSYLRSRHYDFGFDLSIIDSHELHIHVPAGAVPKDGPSAGTALATSILSALLGVAPRALVSMTGEITIHGKVLPIGGLKEKLLAAQREGMELVIIPETNRGAYKEVSSLLRKKLKVEFVSDYTEVFDMLFQTKQHGKALPNLVPESSRSGSAAAS